MSKPNKIDRDMITDRYEYDHEKSCLINKHKGTVINVVKRHQWGYPKLVIDKKSYTLSRIVWTIVNGDIPEGMVIDHIDRDKNNNQIGNLRMVTQSENNRNRVMNDMNTLRERQKKLARQLDT